MSSLVVPAAPVTETFRDAVLRWKNFAGEKRQFNPEGDRNFNLLLDEQMAMALQQQRNKWGDTWNVKERKRMVDEDYGSPEFTLKVAVSYKIKAPRIWLISSGGRAMLGEGMIGMLDDLDSVKVDLVISGFDWEMNGNHGRKAYLQSLFFHMYEDELELEYSAMPQITVSGGDQPAAISSGPTDPNYVYEGEIV